mmetsp:Transcript_62526/g.150753  ORF Transcript_62526/g.150753 Transcript_62526/m.150753 type:complete len:258 (-) Transcript_62526:307-1080(-)
MGDATNAARNSARGRARASRPLALAAPLSLPLGCVPARLLALLLALRLSVQQRVQQQVVLEVPHGLGLLLGRDAGIRARLAAELEQGGHPRHIRLLDAGRRVEQEVGVVEPPARGVEHREVSVGVLLIDVRVNVEERVHVEGVHAAEHEKDRLDRRGVVDQLQPRLQRPRLLLIPLHVVRALLEEVGDLRRVSVVEDLEQGAVDPLGEAAEATRDAQHVFWALRLLHPAAAGVRVEVLAGVGLGVHVTGQLLQPGVR